ncbi:MAG: decaprenyl-phosphate phosphoribosyltransferase [candidate division Zixibacteria bacterium]|nr:decaprenyl-phosphate phosphoribosyltransferase [candidate division Zixibacteria bacterium]
MLKLFAGLIRPGQWIKNTVVLAALVFAGEITSVASVETALAAMVVFCLLSSAVYVFNDLIDREQDQQHPLKKMRPIASGRVSPTVAVVLMLILLAVALAGAYLIGPLFLLVSAAFIVLNLTYTIWLKNIVIVDVMSIGISFVLRALAGAVAIDVPASTWMLINTLFLALFLAFGKRRHELLLLEDSATAHRKILGRYSPYLLDQLIAVVTPSVVVMYMLYSFSTEVSTKLGTDMLFLTIPFVIYGVFRYLYLIHKEECGGSPTKVLISDMPILITVVLWILTVIMVLYVA